MKKIGTVLPLTALPRKMDDAKQFLRWLHKTRQTMWQFLPLHETPFEIRSRTKHLPSPYKGYGVGIDPQLIPKTWKNRIPTKQELSRFINIHRDWLDDYALFVSLRDHFGTDLWTKWPVDIRLRKYQALISWRKKLNKKIQKVIIAQWQAHEAFGEIMKTAKKLRVNLVGDIAFYLPLQSPLVWTYQELFVLDKQGHMRFVSGIPGPVSYFGRQIWGHPLYNWKKSLRPKLAGLWTLRMEYASKLFDMARLDHAVGLYSYGSINLADPSGDRMNKGPGIEFLKTLRNISRKVGLAIYAEDLSSRGRQLRIDLGKLKIRGTRILRFAYKEQERKIEQRYMQIKHYPKLTIASTSNHDTETLMGYLKILSLNEKQMLSKRIGVAFSTDLKTLAINFRNAVIDSPADTVIIPLQDWLLSDARINVPGTEKIHKDKNWHYRINLPISKFPLNLNQPRR